MPVKTFLENELSSVNLFATSYELASATASVSYHRIHVKKLTRKNFT